MPEVDVVPLRADHWPEVRRIYAAGIATGHATFEAEPPSWERFDAGKAREPRLVAVDGDAVLGWAVLSPVSDRPVYAGVLEVSVYVDPAAQGRGVGRALLDTLVTGAARVGAWTLQAGVFPENAGSLALHRAAGFRVVGTRERMGRMTHGPCAGQWRDVVLLERRLDV